MIAVSGVRNSWLMLDRNRLLVRLARCATASASTSSACIRLRPAMLRNENTADSAEDVEQVAVRAIAATAVGGEMRSDVVGIAPDEAGDFLADRMRRPFVREHDAAGAVDADDALGD